ncbi:hypothetical protein [Sphingopyxis sp. JAI108]|uniref:hypothetical protein n=1 Tax=Sphingopyxis sp. JAI108 TaxID=2723060 RepID=UPI0015CCC349|nr:hypothetical protein [Sphingopyxis sp. JAI108]NYF33933.1 hypothetical protein [Sphingopyxis sp. JAI108]
MASALDYLVAATIYRFAYEGHNFSFPDSIDGLQSNLEEYYAVKFDQGVSDKLAKALGTMGVINYSDDRYAGIIISADQNRVNEIFDNLCAQGGIYKSIDDIANSFYKKVISNDDFWKDLRRELSEAGETRSGEYEVVIPAADRTVTVLHNSPEGKEISGVLDTVIDDLSHNNEIAVSAGSDRQRYIAEAKSARELMRGETIRRQAVYEVLWKFFRELLAKFKEKSLEWGIDKVLNLLDDILDLIK